MYFLMNLTAIQSSIVYNHVNALSVLVNICFSTYRFPSMNYIYVYTLIKCVF